MFLTEFQLPWKEIQTQKITTVVSTAGENQSMGAAKISEKKT